jgi:hypothetical protein
MAITPACLLSLKSTAAGGTGCTALGRVTLPGAASGALLLAGMARAAAAFTLTRAVETKAAGLRLDVLVFMRISGIVRRDNRGGDISNALCA